MTRRPPARRMTGLFALLTLGFAGVGTRIAFLQVVDGEQYEAMARDQRVRVLDIPAPRGSIYDRDGNALAISLPSKAVYADPRLVRQSGRVAERLAPLLELPRGDLSDALRQDATFVYLARRVDLPVARRIEAMALPGIGFLDESKRHYPAGDLASQVLGFVGVDGTGLAGLELQYERVLAGRPGKVIIEQAAQGTPIPQGIHREREPSPGEDLVLTIDRDLQYQAQRALEAAVRENGAKGGSVLILDPSSGDVLAMATAPWFDPNRFTEASPDVLRNRSVTDVYEPGSVNKVITAAAALEEGVIGLEETLTVPPTYQVGDKVFSDVHLHGIVPMDLSEIIAQSSNVGIIRVAERLGKDGLADYLRSFGFGRKTGIDFPGEAEGILLDRDDWWTTSMGTIPMGQGIAVTPLQMAGVYATLANEGVRMRPRLVRGVLDAGGALVPERVRTGHRIVSAETAERLIQMLVRAVEEGTGELAAVPGYRVAGKTGTARKPLENALGYSDRYVASFIGIAPADDPRLVIAAILDEPETIYGGVAAAPLFREVARFALADLHVPPTSSAVPGASTSPAG
ncbi:MAG TPA: penicillin-binding protein 2 [Actinomycetota bacterium]